MEKLLASQSQKFTILTRGQQAEGEVVSVNEKEVILDLGTKSEGVVQKRDLGIEQAKNLKAGDKIKVFVVHPENEHGQIVLSTHQQIKTTGGGRDFTGKNMPAPYRSGTGPAGRQGSRGANWSRFSQAQSQKSRLQGKVLEINKGGLIVEVDGARGFLPNSQVGFDTLSKSSSGMDKLIGQVLNLTVVEVDSLNNKLIFTQRGQVSDEVKSKLKEFKSGQKATGKIIGVLPFGLVVDISGVEGLVFIADVAWEKVEDLSKDFKVGQEIEVIVTGIDEELGRLNLSIKQLSEDPFKKLAEKYPADEVVKAEVVSVSDTGVSFKLADGVEGFLPVSKMSSNNAYEVGKSITLIVDSVDSSRRRVNLASFVTSTEGLIYK